MKKYFRDYWPLWILVLLFAMLALSVHAQEANSQPQISQMAQISNEGTSAFPPQAMVALILPLLVGMLKGFVPERFRKWIPLAMPLIGEIATQVLSNLPSGSGAVAGLAGVGVREAVDNAKRSGPPKGGTTYSLALFLIVACAASAGCAVLDKASSAVTVGKANLATNEVVRFVTNEVVIPMPVAVPGSNVFVTNFVAVPRVMMVTNREVVTNLIYEVKPGLQAGIAAGQTVAPLVPGPYGAAAAGGLAILSGVLGVAAAYKNKQKGEVSRQLEAVIKGIEKTEAIDEQAGAKAKVIIAEVSKAMGVSDGLHATVQEVKAAQKAQI